MQKKSDTFTDHFSKLGHLPQIIKFVYTTKQELITSIVRELEKISMGVVYFDQLLGDARTQKPVKIIFDHFQPFVLLSSSFQTKLNRFTTCLKTFGTIGGIF